MKKKLPTIYTIFSPSGAAYHTTDELFPSKHPKATEHRSVVMIPGFDDDVDTALFWVVHGFSEKETT